MTPRRPPEAEAALLSPPLPMCDATNVNLVSCHDSIYITSTISITFPTFSSLSILNVLYSMVIMASLCITLLDSVGTASSVNIQAPTPAPQKAGLQLTAGSKILQSEVWQNLIWHAGVAATSD